MKCQFVKESSNLIFIIHEFINGHAMIHKAKERKSRTWCDTTTLITVIEHGTAF